MDLKNKTILILSPQRWGKMFISKHHYAIALARRGNKVYFLNPPDDPIPASGNIAIKESGVHANLFLVEHKLFFPYRLKFHALPVFHFFMRWQVKRILQFIKDPIDIVWSFELGYFYPFRFFPATALKVFHPVDEPLGEQAIATATGAHIVFSVTQEILDKYAHLDVARHFINHGLADEFAGMKRVPAVSGSAIAAGFSGNLLREDIDRVALLTIIKENPAVKFECWGSYQVADSNIGGAGNEAQQSFIRQLQSLPNVLLHGPVSVQALAASLPWMDLFLICYDIKKDQSKGTNYHKVMEFLSTGKVIVSNNITTYNNRPSLVQMTPDREDNRALPALFKQVTTQLEQYNTQALQQERIEFALDNTYERQVERIENIVAGITT